MAIVGNISEIWRYPVKSMQGESLTQCVISELGILGDRGWALRDEQSGEIKGAKKFPKLMQIKARYITEPNSDQIIPADITFPNGDTSRCDAPNINEQLSNYLGSAVSLFPRLPADNLEHYRRRVALNEPELRSLLAREPDEQLPDLSIMAPEVIAEITEFTSPRGTYFDAYPIHLLTTSWLAALSETNPTSRFETARFRPNFVIDGAEQGLAELDWCGKRLRIGEAEFDCDAPTVRCGMTTRATADLPDDTKVLRTIVRETDQNVGAYATVNKSGPVKIGDTVELI
jgi:uncharacterized protein YcbX